MGDRVGRGLVTGWDNRGRGWVTGWDNRVGR